jgi:hypothetical protein
MKQLIYQQYNFESNKSTDTFLSELEHEIPEGLFVHFSKRPIDNGYTFIYQTNWMRINGKVMTRINKTELQINVGPTSTRLVSLTIYLLVFFIIIGMVISSGHASQLILFLIGLVMLVTIGLSITFHLINRAKRRALQIVFNAAK